MFSAFLALTLFGKASQSCGILTCLHMGPAAVELDPTTVGTAMSSDISIIVGLMLKYLWERRCLQGTFHAQQLIACDVTESAAISVLELDRCSGWCCHRATVGTHSIQDILDFFLATGWLRPSTFHLKGVFFIKIHLMRGCTVC